MATAKQKKSESVPEKRSSSPKPTTPSQAIDRQKMVSEAAYYLAERRGFGGGNELEDWLMAEQQIDASLGRYES